MATDAFDGLAETLVRGSEQSYVAYLTERFLDMLDEAVTNPDRLQVLASRSKIVAMQAWDRFRGKVTKETQDAFTEAMRGEDELLVSSLAKAYGYDHGLTSLTTKANNELNEAARGMSEVMRRQNVALADDVADMWYKVTSDAVTGMEMGKGYREVMEDAISRLSDAGLETIDYRSGVRTTIDAATRRHVVSQSNQAKADLLNRRCDEWGCDLVMVSAHFGARPSHAEWQGKVYSRSGRDKRYPSLDEGTGYHGTGPHAALGDRLCGVNCLHSMTPYVPGYSQLPSTDFSEQEERVGMSSDEYYAAKQRQRGMERKVRQLKRRVALGQERGLDMTADRYRLGRAQASLRAHCATTGLRRDYERERAYGVAQQPRGLGRVDFNAPKWHGQYPNPTAKAKTTSPSPTFSPAKTVEEAQGYAGRFIKQGGFSPTFKGQANYKGLSTETANEVNRTLDEIYSKFDMPKLSGIKAISPKSAQGKKVFSDSDAIMAYNPVEHGIFLNKEILKNAETLAGHNGEASRAWDIVMDNLDKLRGRQLELATRYKAAGRSLVGDGTVHDYTVHEMGHHAEWTMLGASEHNAMGKSMSTYAPRISGYANASTSEYIAESFSAYVKGETSILDPSFVSIMERGDVSSGTSTATSTGVEYGRLGISPLPELRLPPREYAQVMSEISTSLSKEMQGRPVAWKALGNYIYTFENDWENRDFSIIGKVPIDEVWR